ncbi:12-oxophytodienoate reductase, putative [Phytophthora infestans T30-4]|uniref:12-oxophytodienoate reductase, putative n=1 Tax=Phytophthora infestans (strain T30-4) TaxID=403677 RepID=D0MSH4_PHYIT|nr:12-oxophytodienoate reductase, putative [Phytophthora infestans T30-4]EEY58443.1 12-oxophytodienoate reductase, putative [Phytophthora infestans T30-4]|eukprot:XP_002909629.1 12-oxophytodienoate reductase, putative [Phytophthora infestans T30-4]
MSTPKLFSPLTLGGDNPVRLQHRVVMAPLTRLRTGETGVPTDLVAEYYAQRSTPGGLIIAEATNISPTARGYFGAPGLFTSEQVESWKKVTRAVHAKGGKIFVQLWHTGRVGHPLNQPNGVLPVSSSAVGLEGVNTSAVTREGRRKYVTPRALETREILGVIADYKRAAENAIAAGFDGVELHGANGYLLEQFLCDGVNKRSDKYGGGIENRARLMFEALDAVLSSLKSSQVAIRLSPFGVTFGCTDSTPAETYAYVLKKLNALNLAYVHIVEPRGFHFRGPHVPKDGTTPFCRSLYHGVLMTSSAFNRAEGIKITEDGMADCVAYGRPFISNPDFVKRLKAGSPWNPWDRKTFYMPAKGPLSLGYTDYPAFEQKSAL